MKFKRVVQLSKDYPIFILVNLLGNKDGWLVRLDKEEYIVALQQNLNKKGNINIQLAKSEGCKFLLIQPEKSILADAEFKILEE